MYYADWAKMQAPYFVLRLCEVSPCPYPSNQVLVLEGQVLVVGLGDSVFYNTTY